MTYACYQGNEHDCGFAALKMLLANTAKNKSYLYLRKPAKKKDYTLSDLIHIAKQNGFVLMSFEIPKEDIKELRKGCIVLINEKHAVYLKKVGKYRTVYYDSECGRVSIANKEFIKIFTGIAMECTNATNAKKLKLKKERMTPIWMDITHYIIIGAIFTFLLTGFYMISDDSSIIVTMVFLALFAILELVENWYILKELKFFDNKYLPKYFSRKCNQNTDRYRSYVDFKSKHYIVSKLLVSSLVIILTFSVLLCVNDYRNVFAFLILLLLKMLDYKIFAKQEKDSVKEIESIESIAFDSETTIIHSLTRANTLANKVGLRHSMKRIVYMFVSLCPAIGMMLGSHVTSSNFIIFHFGIYFFMSDAFDNVIKYFSNSRERKLQVAHFLDDCNL